MIDIRKLSLAYKLNLQQEDNIRGILNECEKQSVTDKRHIAYILATVKHECDNTWHPIKEYGGIAYFIKRYWLNSRVAKMLGNDNAEDAAKYAGRGYVMITGEDNYARFTKITGVDLINFPDKAMDTNISAVIIVYGMKWGAFTGRKLSDYFPLHESNPISARKIINSLDKAELIAKYYSDILEMI